MRCRYNPNCLCARCRAHGYMGPTVLITLGVLFLLDQMGHANWMEFHFTWPALLIVIGVVKLLEHGASTEGHIPREYGSPAWQSRDQRYYPGQPGSPNYPGAPPVVTPPPGQPAGFVTPPPPAKGPDEQGGA